MNSSILCLGSFGSFPVILSSDSYADECPDYIDHEFSEYVKSAELIKSDVLLIRVDSFPNGSSSFTSVVRVDNDGKVLRL